MKTQQQIEAWATESPPAARAMLGVKSENFSVRIRVTQDDVELATDALLRRADPTGIPAIVWRRPRY
jgi:hypothetical protein